MKSGEDQRKGTLISVMSQMRVAKTESGTCLPYYYPPPATRSSWYLGRDSKVLGFILKTAPNTSFE
jgi:hypothetical protein